MDIIYREYEEKDRDILFQLTTKLDQYVKNLDPLQRIKLLPGFSEISFKDLLEDIRKNQGKILLVQDGNKVVGYVVGAIWEQEEKNKLEIGEHKLGEVLELYLEEPYRGQGIGKKMLQMMEQYFKKQGCDSIWVDFFAANENAHKTYKSFGFVDRNIGMLKNI